MAVQNINTYQGDAALGQGTTGIGIGPIGVYEFKNANDAMDKLMQYQVMQNRDTWARNNLLLDQQAKQAAADLTFSIGDWLPGDRDTIMGKINKMNSMYAQYPNRTRLLSDGSNQKEVAEWQNMGNEIQADIQRANTRKAQQLGLIKQYEAEVDDEEKNQIIDWKNNYEKTDISKDILLYPSITPYVPPPTPVVPYHASRTWDAEKNQFTIEKITAPNMAAGMAQIVQDMQSPKGSKARKYIYDGVNKFNKAIDRVKAENPELAGNEEELRRRLEATDEGRTYMELVKAANVILEFNNTEGFRTSTNAPEIAQINWFDGIDENDYIKMTVAGNAKGTTREFLVDFPKIGIEEQQLKQAGQRIAQGWAEINLRRAEFDRGKEKEVDPLIKNAVITTLLTAPYQPGVNAGTTEVPIPINQEIKNIFGIPITETEVESGIGEAKTTKTKYNQLEITSVKAKKVGGDPNNTVIEVQYKNPVDNTVTTNVYDRASLSVPANNIFGNTYAQKVAAADAEYKAKLGTTNPTIQQMGYVAGGRKEATGNTTNDPLALPLLPNGQRDNGKMVKGKYYMMPNGSVLLFKG